MDRYLGKRLDGRYEIREIIGVGGMAVVYKAYDTIEDRIVAIKILKAEFVSNEDFVRRFKNESKAIAVLSHANIVKVYDVSFGDLIQYIVMEYIDGITLKQYIETKGSIPWKSTVAIVMQILRALQHAHDKGIIHRDVKPQNIMITAEGTIKVTDFGIARFARSDYKTITDKAIGSVHYISPEQARSETTDEKADIYSVGVIMYEMLSGKLPFEAESAVIVAMMQLQNEAKPLRELNPTIPLGLAQITMNAMEKEVLRRYQTAAEMLCDIESFRRDPSATFERNYYVDSAPTRFIQAETEIAKKQPEPEVNSHQNEEKTHKKRKIWVPILAGILVAIAVAGLAFLATQLWNSLTSPTEAKKVPDFLELNLTYDEIKKKYGNDFNLEKIEDTKSPLEPGTVIAQDPKAGEMVKKKEKIKLTVAKGQDLVEVPYVFGQTKKEAQKTLEKIGLKNLNFVIEKSDSPKGTVFQTDPAKGSKVYPDRVITVKISDGPKIEKVKVPNLIGMSEEDVEEFLKSKGLELGSTSYSNSETSAGYIIGQGINENEEVDEGTKINIVVSKGQKEVKKIDLRITIPSDYFDADGNAFANISVEFTGNSNLNKSAQDVRAGSTQSFEITSDGSNKTDLAKVYIIDYNDQRYPYQTYKFDFENGTVENIETLNNYPKNIPQDEVTDTSTDIPTVAQ